MRSSRLCKSVLSSVLLGLFLACGAREEGDVPEEEAAVAPDAAMTLTDVGFATPESVRYDPTPDVYLVSNINGDPFAEDGNGFISRVSPEGEVLELKWIDGAAEGVTLNAPKGIAIAGDRVYVTDIRALRMFNRTTGAPEGEITIPDATFLNDVAAGADGSIYITDSGFNPGFEPSGTDAVYRIDPEGMVETVASGADLGGPNGVTIVDGAIWVATFRSGELYRVADGSKQDAEALPSGSLDGLESHDGQFYVSSWDGQSILRGTPGGTFEAEVSGLEAPADFGIDTGRDRLLIPLFQANEVRITPIAPTSSE